MHILNTCVQPMCPSRLHTWCHFTGEKTDGANVNTLSGQVGAKGSVTHLWVFLAGAEGTVLT